MSRTRRVYNRYLKKTQRYYAGTAKQCDGCDVMLGDIIGMPYHPYHQICMGRCSICRDPSLNQKHLRKHRARELRQVVKDEGYNFIYF